MEQKKIINLLSFFTLLYFFIGTIAAIYRLPYTFVFCLVVGFLAALKIIVVVEGKRIVEAIEGLKNAK